MRRALFASVASLAVLWLLNEARARATGYVLAAALYAACAAALTRLLGA